MVIDVEQSNVWRKVRLNWRIGCVIIFIGLMMIAIRMMALSGTENVADGQVDLSRTLFKANQSAALNGRWEFYWNRLLMPADFAAKQAPQMDSLMKVPGTWADKKAGAKDYPNQGVATYRLQIRYPATLKDPALRIQNVAAAYRLYANGQLIREVGKVSDKLSGYQEGEEALILDLPKDKQTLELIIQVANLNYASGGLRESPIFGSKEVLTQEKMRLLVVQLFFIGSIFIFGVYYFLLFLLQIKNKTALFFSLICFITALRSLIWGAAPLAILFPHVSFYIRVYINYLTGYNLLPMMALFVLSLYPLASKKTIGCLVLLPTLFFNALLLTSSGFMSLFTNYLYIVVLIQMIYINYILIKAVLLKRDNAIFMLVTIGIFVLTIIQDILYYRGIGGANVAYMFLFGNFAVIMAMSFVQARQQAVTHKKLIRYNEKLIEADQLKDKIMETEMSFLQAQIKPHFLYNALDAIANVCEEDGEKASELIVDLSIYLRKSLEFNSLDKMVRIEKELEFVRTYFNIEQARFGQKIRLIEEIEISLDRQIPILILQPLVENAVRHGISKKPQGGTIHLRMKQIDEAVCLEIEDDGAGIEAEKLAHILDEEREEKGVGLLNIHLRLLKLYGRGLAITSEVGSGTKVKIFIPERRNRS